MQSGNTPFLKSKILEIREFSRSPTWSTLITTTLIRLVQRREKKGEIFPKRSDIYQFQKEMRININLKNDTSFKSLKRYILDFVGSVQCRHHKGTEIITQVTFLMVSFLYRIALYYYIVLHCVFCHL